MFFDKKAREVEDLMKMQYGEIRKILEALQLLILEYYESNKEFKKASYIVHKMEHDADKIRRDIGRKIYDGAYLPIYREDFYRLVRRADDIADKAEAIGDFITLTRPCIPEFIFENLKLMVEKNLESFNYLNVMLTQFLDGESDIITTGLKIQELESEIDALQFHTTRAVFKSPMEKIEKFHTKTLIDLICKISDLVEDLSDQFEIVSAKQRL